MPLITASSCSNNIDVDGLAMIAKRGSSSSRRFSTGTSATMQVRVINLRDSTERRQSMARQLAATGIDFSFFEGTDGRALTADDLERYARTTRLRKYGVDLTPGEIGAYLSHYKVIAQAFEAGTPRVLVLEDDAIVPESLGDILRFLDSLPQNFEFIKLYGARTPAGIDLTNFSDGRRLARVLNASSGAVAYAMSHSGAAKFVAAGATIIRQIDVELDRYWIHGLRSYAVLPYPIGHLQAGGPSVIGERVDVWDLPGMRHWRRRTRLLKLGDSLRKRAKNLQVLLDNTTMS